MNNQNPQNMAMSIINGLHNSGRLSNDQYDSIVKNKDNPQGIVSVLLQSGIVTNEQVNNARQQAGTFFGIK